MKVLVVVDCQNDFITGPLGSPEARAIVPYIKELIKNEAPDTKIIFTKDTHYNNYLNTQEGRNLPVEHCIQGSKGWEINSELLEVALNDNDHDEVCFLNKESFGLLDLGYYLYDGIFEEIEEIKLVGVCTGICVISNALILKAHEPEVSIVVDAKGCACVTPESHQRALDAMKMCQIKVINE